MPTPHINAQYGDFAKTVLMPGDPNRAKWIAEKFLIEPRLVTDVRGILGYTGKTPDGKLISVMASGMGNPSISIYAHELFNAYGVEQIIRIGTCGVDDIKINLKDIIIAMGSCTDSNIINSYDLHGIFSAIADYDLIRKSVEAAERLGINYHVGNVLASDVFYDDNNVFAKFHKFGVIAVEMESYGLYFEAAKSHKKALTILSVSDNFANKGQLSSSERETGLENMIKIALTLAE